MRPYANNSVGLYCAFFVRTVVPLTTIEAPTDTGAACTFDDFRNEFKTKHGHMIWSSIKNISVLSPSPEVQMLLALRDCIGNLSRNRTKVYCQVRLWAYYGLDISVGSSWFPTDCLASLERWSVLSSACMVACSSLVECSDVIRFTLST